MIGASRSSHRPSRAEGIAGLRRLSEHLGTVQQLLPRLGERIRAPTPQDGHLAVEVGCHSALVELLGLMRATLDRRDALEGTVTALGAAMSEGHDETAAVLRANGAECDDGRTVELSGLGLAPE